MQFVSLHMCQACYIDWYVFATLPVLEGTSSHCVGHSRWLHHHHNGGWKRQPGWLLTRHSCYQQHWRQLCSVQMPGMVDMAMSVLSSALHTIHGRLFVRSDIASQLSGQNLLSNTHRSLAFIIDLNKLLATLRQGCVLCRSIFSRALTSSPQIPLCSLSSNAT